MEPSGRAMRRDRAISAGQQRGTDTGVPVEAADVFGIDTVVPHAATDRIGAAT